MLANNRTYCAEDLLKVEDLAQRLQCSPRKVWSLISSGELRSIKIGKLVRVLPQDLDAFIERHARESVT